MRKEDAKKGMRVIFGKGQGEKSLGKIQKCNPSRAKVELLEERGTHKTHEVGTVFNVPYSLMEPEGTPEHEVGQRPTRKGAPSKVEKGMQFRSVIADCNALWEVKRPQGRGAWMCEVVNEPWEHDGKTYDGDYAGQQQVFTDQQILSSIGMANLFQGLADETDQFQASLAVGDIIHYDNGFNQFVRCEIALKDGKTYAKPIALVGEWRSHDLPRRYEDGTVHNGYHADQILNPEKERPGTKTHWFPNASSTYESPSYHRKAKSIDPRNLDPIDLTLPEMTEGEAETARVWQIVKQAKALLEGDEFKTPQGKLTAVKGLLDGEIW